MSKFIYIYNGPAPMDQFTEEQSALEMAKWGAWMGKVGAAMLDGGPPLAPVPPSWTTAPAPNPPLCRAIP